MDTLLLLELTDNLTEALAQLEQAKDDTLATLDAIDAVNEALIALGGESVEAIVTDYTALLKQIVNDEINLFESKEKMQELELALNGTGVDIMSIQTMPERTLNKPRELKEKLDGEKALLEGQQPDNKLSDSPHHVAPEGTRAEADLPRFNEADLNIAQPQANASELNAQEQAVMDVMLKSGAYNFTTSSNKSDFSQLADLSEKEFETVKLILKDTSQELSTKVIKHILENNTDYPNANGKNMFAVSDLDGMNIAPLAKLAKIKKTAKTPDDLFKLMALSAAAQDVRHYITGVKVEDNGDLISTDGQTMTIIRDSGVKRKEGIYTTHQNLQSLRRALIKQGKSQEEIEDEIKKQENSFNDLKFPDYKRVYPRKNLVAAENIFNIDVAKLKGIVDSIVKAFRRVISNKFFGISLEFNQNKIFFNVQYLQNGLDLMASMGYKHVNFYLRDADSSVLIEPEDEKVSFVVMPMRNNRGFDAIKTINLNNIDDWNWSKSSFDDVDTDDDEEFEQEIEQLLFF